MTIATSACADQVRRAEPEDTRLPCSELVRYRDQTRNGDGLLFSLARTEGDAIYCPAFDHRLSSFPSFQYAMAAIHTMMNSPAITNPARLMSKFAMNDQNGPWR